jgi:hypothetical protein
MSSNIFPHFPMYFPGSQGDLAVTLQHCVASRTVDVRNCHRGNLQIRWLKHVETMICKSRNESNWILLSSYLAFARGFWRLLQDEQQIKSYKVHVFLSPNFGQWEPSSTVTVQRCSGSGSGRNLSVALWPGRVLDRVWLKAKTTLKDLTITQMKWQSLNKHQ